MKLTEKKLRSLSPCRDGLDWYMEQEETDLQAICFALIDQSLTGWANWVLSRLMTKRQRIGFAIYAAEQVIHIFEAGYPKDTRPRDAIETAKRYLKAPTDKNKKAAAVAAVAARAAARDARDADDASDAYFDDAVAAVANAVANAAANAAAARAAANAAAAREADYAYAARAARAAANAADAAANAASAAAEAVDDANESEGDAEDAAADAVNAVDASYAVTEAGRKSIQLEIINYGLKILAEKKKRKI